jgi:Amt family ammonium transporter
MHCFLTAKSWWSIAVAIALGSILLTPGPSFAQEEAAETVAEEVVVEEAAAEAAPEDLGVGYALTNAMLFLAAVLVFFMQAGFAMVEAGFNSSKNAVNILFKNTMDFCVGVLLYYAIGFGLMYPGNYGVDTAENKYFAFGGVGLSKYMELKAADPTRPYSPEVDWFFQAVFAATAATIVSGAVAGRMKIGAYLVYSAVISGFVYPISGMWKWGGGWLTQFADGMKFQDFAGSAVVHAVGGFAGLAGAMIIGPRLGRYVGGKVVPMPGHSLPIATLGVFILWFGWYGFNPGSNLAFSTSSASDAVMHIALTTTLAGAAGGLVATFLSWGMYGKPDLSMGLNGILAGLVGITAGCDAFALPMSIVVGAIAGALVVAGIIALDKLKIDDPVGAFPVHGLCGMWGCMALGILPNAHLDGGATSFMVQLIGTFSIAAWSFVTMFALFSILKAIGFLRVGEHEELKGLDISEHGMQAYGVQPA